jgi:hypothetical protein
MHSRVGVHVAILLSVREQDVADHADVAGGLCGAFEVSD